MAQQMDVKAELKKYFDEADVDHRGVLTVAQAKVVLEKALEFTLEDRLTTRIIERCDVDHSGNINFDEFCSSAKSLVQTLKELVSEFHTLDQDETGFLGRAEITRMLNLGCCGGLREDDQLVEGFFIDCDKNMDGRISFHEFLYFMAGELLRQEKR